MQPAKSTRSVNPLDRCFFSSCACRAEPTILLKLFLCFSLCPKHDYNMCRPKRKAGEITNGTKKNYRRSDTGLSPISDPGRKERGHRGEIPPGRPCFSSLYRSTARSSNGWGWSYRKKPDIIRIMSNYVQRSSSGGRSTRKRCSILGAQKHNPFHVF